jgi:hypothetical protein
MVPDPVELDCADGELELAHPDSVIAATAFLQAKGQYKIMIKFTSPKVIAVATALLASSTAVAGAVSPMPLSSQWRACDFSKLAWVSAVGDSRIIAEVSASGSTVSAHVDAAQAPPGTRYDVRIIQTPRASNGCAAGDPGVISGSLQINDAGMGSVTVQGPVASGKTGAWVIVDLPTDNSQTPKEFYTSEYIAAI